MTRLAELISAVDELRKDRTEFSEEDLQSLSSIINILDDRLYFERRISALNKKIPKISTLQQDIKQAQDNIRITAEKVHVRLPQT